MKVTVDGPRHRIKHQLLEGQQQHFRPFFDTRFTGHLLGLRRKSDDPFSMANPQDPTQLGLTAGAADAAAAATHAAAWSNYNSAAAASASTAAYASYLGQTAATGFNSATAALSYG